MPDDRKPEDRALADEFLDYVRRGRRFLSLPPSELNERWIAAFRDVVSNSMVDRVVDMDDFAAELRLEPVPGICTGR